MTGHKISPKTIDEAVEHLHREFPREFLDAIMSLSNSDLKSYQSALDEHIKNSLIEWLHNNTTVLEQCGSYSAEEVIGFVIWHLWTVLQEAPTYNSQEAMD